MRKLILFILISICIDVSAQRQSKSKYKLGYKIGVVSSRMTGGRIKSRSRTVFEGGVWCQIKLTKKWSAQTEIIFVEKGTGGLPAKRPPRIGDYAVSIMYIEAPVLFQYHLKNFIFETGLGLGALIYQFESLYGAPTPNMTSAYPFTTKEFSFNFGCGYSFNEKWYFELRYTNSLLPVRKQIPDIPKQVYNRAFAITLAHNLIFKKPKTIEAQSQE